MDLHFNPLCHHVAYLQQTQKVQFCVCKILLNSANFHLEVVETLCKMKTKSRGNRKRKIEVKEGIEEKT